MCKSGYQFSAASNISYAILLRVCYEVITDLFSRTAPQTSALVLAALDACLWLCRSVCVASYRLVCLLPITDAHLQFIQFMPDVVIVSFIE